MATTSLPQTGFGLLGFTWRPAQVPDEQAFPTMKAAVENGATIWSSSSIYVTLFIRACYDSTTFSPTCTRDGVRTSWEECNQILGGVKKIDVFGPARIDQNVPVEETISALKELVDEGKIGSIGLSEVRAETIRRASAISPIKFTEVEFSLWSTEILDNGVAATAKEHNVILLSYAPLGYGFLSGTVKKLEDIPQGDTRHMFGRFQPENFSKNLDLVDKIHAFAKNKGMTSAQLALAWIRIHSGTGNCGIIIPIPGATGVIRVNENCKAVKITTEEKEELDKIIKSFDIAGHRQIPGMDRRAYQPHRCWHSAAKYRQRKVKEGQQGLKKNNEDIEDLLNSVRDHVKSNAGKGRKNPRANLPPPPSAGLTEKLVPLSVIVQNEDKGK
ncbi:NAD(P)-linked oxidoreductase [Venustampulla echinocandica]|uniref:NAD(P)-linked oxidoreductase n=1 Tax=Venustampulla echinocandica TaxID=2656787 RepID=A0A370TT83_9HELO|nr:NAD(P)-linked oxidoreductase [Venustampulla echinocandica]RDL38737.1 NAD(P)-linked oxidoreductase [Venustampulla echinocandica]